MTIEAKWTDELDPVLRDAPLGDELVSLDGVGVELEVRPEGRLARVAAAPAVARTREVARTAGRSAARAATGAARVTFAATVAKPAPKFSRTLARFASGQLMTGPERTDATFWRDGRRQGHDVAGESSKWVYRARWKRATARTGALLVVWAGCFLYAPRTTGLVTGALALIVALWGAWALRCWLRARHHRADVLRPLHDALATVVAPPSSRPEDWLHVPERFKENPGTPIRIDLPSAFAGQDKGKQVVSAIVRAKLALDDATRESFQLEGKHPYATFKEPVPVPKNVTLEDIMPHLKKARETAPIIGLTTGGDPVDVDLESDSPHILISAGSGAGKSVLMRAILAQGLAKGGYGIVLDVKMISQRWAKGLPNCEYHRTAEAIHDALVNLRKEVDRRNNLVDRYADIEGKVIGIDLGPRIWLFVEEINATIGLLRKWWAETREKDDPKTSPAVEAFLDLLFMGRQIKINVLTAAQMATARALGGPEGRENFGTRCMARYTTNAWKMLCPEVWPAPKRSKLIGRWQIVKSGVATETQVVFMTNKEARELAQIGLPSADRQDYVPPAVPGSHSSHDRDDLGQAAETVPAEVVDTPPPADSQNGDLVPVSSRAVGLRQAIDEGVVMGMSLANLRKGPQRDPHFPKPIGQRGAEKLYAADELGKWARNRLAVIGDSEGGESE